MSRISPIDQPLDFQVFGLLKDRTKIIARPIHLNEIALVNNAESEMSGLE